MRRSARRAITSVAMVGTAPAGPAAGPKPLESQIPAAMAPPARKGMATAAKGHSKGRPTAALPASKGPATAAGRTAVRAPMAS